MNRKPSCVDPPHPGRSQSRAFSAVARYYRTLHNGLRDRGEGPYRLTALGAWATSRAPHLFSFFRRIDLSRYDLFIDLGSGDGIVTCIAGLFTRSVGIEIDAELCDLAQRAARELKLADRVSFICGNYLELRIRRAGCLYHYPDKPLDDLERLLTGWNGVLLIYGPHLPPRSLVSISRLECGRERLVVYEKSPSWSPR